MNRKLVEYNSVPVGTRYALGNDYAWGIKQPNASRHNFLVYVPRTIAFVGHGRHGKDECCRMWAEITGGTNAGTLSLYLAPVVLQYLETLDTPQILQACAETYDRDTLIAVISTFSNRHHYRAIWRAAGDWARRDDPTALIKLALAKGNITGGIRGKAEVVAGRSLLDLIVWVQRPGFPDDPTMEYGPEEADIVISNDGTLEQLAVKLKRLWEAFR